MMSLLPCVRRWFFRAVPRSSLRRRLLLLPLPPAAVGGGGGPTWCLLFLCNRGQGLFKGCGGVKNRHAAGVELRFVAVCD